MSLSLARPVGPQARSIIEAQGRLNLWYGSVSSGKTVASLLRWLEFVATGPDGELAMAGKTERTLKRNCLDLMEDWLGDDLQVTRGTGEARLWGRRIYLFGANDERAADRIKGMTLAGAYVDEATTWPENVWAMLLTRCRVKGAKVFATTNPDSPAHWLKERYIDRGDEADVQMRTFQLNIPDNPNLDADYVRAMRAQFVGVWAKRYIEGLWVAAEGAIYDMLDTERHVSAELPERLDRWTLALDYGTASVTHGVLLAVGSDDRLWALREWVWDARKQQRQLTDGELTRNMADWLDTGAQGVYLLDEKPHPVPLEALYVDPSAASLRRQLQSDGWGWPNPADNKVLDGIRSVGNLLAADRLRVHPSCERLVKELQGYVWDSKAQEQGEDKPVKLDDHGPDALRYGVMGLLPVWRSWVNTDYLGRDQ